MRILVLDDQKIVALRPESYLINPHDFRDDEIVQVIGEGRFYELLYYDGPWDEVWLDHDLGRVEYNGKTITTRIQELCFTGEHMADVRLFRVITNNPTRGNDMADDLERCGYEVARTPIFTIRGVERGDYFVDPQ